MSSGMLFVLWKGLLGFGVPIALGLWELHRLRRYRDEDATPPAPPPPPPVAPGPPAPRAAEPRARERERVPELV